MLKDKVLVTGATGNVGFELVKMLKAEGIVTVAAVRKVEQAQRILGDGLKYLKFDFNEVETIKGALGGVSKIFLVRPPQISNVKKYIFPFIDYACKSGVKQIVFLSLLGVEKNPLVPHYKIEQYIISSGIAYTFIRASFFMQNLNTTHLEDIKEKNEIFVPAGQGKTSFIDIRDIAEAALKVLAESGHNNKAYSLTGSKALDYCQVAEIFSRVLHKKIVYPAPSIINFFIRMKKKGHQTAYILIMIALYTTARLGLAKKITKDLKYLLNRDPISMEQYVKDYQKYFL